MQMIRFYLLTVTLLLIFIPQTIWAKNAPPTGVDTYDHITVRIQENDIVAIHGLFERYDSTVNAGQAEEWMSLFSDDIIWMNPDQPALVGKDAVRGSVGPLFADLNNEHVITVDEVSVAGNWAFVRTTYTWRFTPKAGGETSEELGKEVFILRRQTDSSWRITRAIWNKNHTAPAQ